MRKEKHKQNKKVKSYCLESAKICCFPDLLVFWRKVLGANERLSFFEKLKSHCLEHIKTHIFPEFPTFWKTTDIFDWFGRNHTAYAFFKNVNILGFHEIYSPILEILKISNLLLTPR